MELPSLKQHVGQVVIVLNLIQGLKDSGVNTDKLIRQSQLRYFNLSDPEAYLPIQVIYDFFAVIKKSQQIDNICVTFSDYFSLDKIGAYGELIASSKRLLPAAQNAVKFQKTYTSLENVSFEIKDDGVHFTNKFIGQFTPTQSIIEDIDLGMQLRTIKLSNKVGWSPKEIHIRGTDTALIEHEFPNHNAKIKLNQEHVGVVFDLASLANPLYQINGNEPPPVLMGSIPPTLSGKLETLFDQLQGNYLPTLAQTSQMYCCTVADMQDDLKNEFTSYSELLDRWRFIKAVKLLTETKLKINEISDELFYSNAANFTRSFIRWTSLRPKDFR